MGTTVPELLSRVVLVRIVPRGGFSLSMAGGVGGRQRVVLNKKEIWVAGNKLKNSITFLF